MMMKIQMTMMIKFILFFILSGGNMIKRKKPSEYSFYDFFDSYYVYDCTDMRSEFNEK